jgi:hypothetical protein
LYLKYQLNADNNNWHECRYAVDRDVRTTYKLDDTIPVYVYYHNSMYECYSELRQPNVGDYFVYVFTTLLIFSGTVASSIPTTLILAPIFNHVYDWIYCENKEEHEYELAPQDDPGLVVG